MAEPVNTSKRHKPIEPPSPEIGNFPSNSHRNYENYEQQRRSSPNRYRRYEGDFSQKQLSVDDDDSNYQSQRAKASVFERLGGNVASQPKRSNVCLNWSNTGSCPRGRQCMYLHPPLSSNEFYRGDVPQSNHHQSSENYGQRRYDRHHQKDYHGHVPNGDEDFMEHSLASKVHSKSGSHGHGSQDELDTSIRRDKTDNGNLGYSSSRGTNSAKCDQKEHSRNRVRESSYPTSLGSPELSDQESAKLRSKVVVTKSKNSEPKDTHGQANNSGRKPTISPDEDSGGDLRELASEEALEKKLKLLKRQLKELDEGDGDDAHSAATTSSGNQTKEKLTEKRDKDSESPSKRHVGKNGMVSVKHSDSTPGRSKRPVDAAIRSTTPERLHSSSGSSRTHSRNDSSRTHQSNYHERRITDYDHRASGSQHRRLSAEKRNDNSKNRTSKKRSLSPGRNDRRHSTSTKRSRHDERKNDVAQNNHRESSTKSRNSSSDKVSGLNGGIPKLKETELEKTETSATLLVKRELEPISDDEVDEIIDEASPSSVKAEPVTDQVEMDASTSQQPETKRKVDMLDVEWTNAIPENKELKFALSSRRRRFDVNYFLPTIGICGEYLSGETLDRATTSAVGDEGDKIALAMQNYRTTKRRRLFEDALSPFPRAISARSDLKLRRQLCGLVAEIDTTSNAIELNVPSNVQHYRKALSTFEKWTKTTGDHKTTHKDEFRTT